MLSKASRVSSTVQLVGFRDAKVETVKRALAHSRELAAEGLAIRSHEGAIYVPRDLTAGDQHINGRSCYSSSGIVIPETVHRNSKRLLCEPSDSNKSWLSDVTIHTAIERGIYGGISVPHFGHLLVDGMARLWCLEQLPHDIPIVLSGGGGKLSQQMIELYELAGIERRRILRPVQPCRIHYLLVPDESMIVRSFMHSLHCSPMAKNVGYIIAGKNYDRHRLVYLSRSRLAKQKQRISNEEAIEGLVRANGGIVVHPQELSIVDQVSLFYNTDVIAGCWGSAFHAILGSLPQIARPRLVYLCGDDFTINLPIIDDCRGYDSWYLRAIEGRGLSAHCDKELVGEILSQRLFGADS